MAETFSFARRLLRSGTARSSACFCRRICGLRLWLRASKRRFELPDRGMLRKRPGFDRTTSTSPIATPGNARTATDPPRDSLFFVLFLVMFLCRGEDLLGDGLRHYIVMIHLHMEAPAALCHRGEALPIAEHFRHGNFSADYG